jgi:hypothetical protein
MERYQPSDGSTPVSDDHVLASAGALDVVLELFSKLTNTYPHRRPPTVHKVIL